jgi:hypothetical protein
MNITLYRWLNTSNYQKIKRNIREKNVNHSLRILLLALNALLSN